MAWSKHSTPDEPPGDQNRVGMRVVMTLAFLLYLFTASFMALPGAPAGWLLSASTVAPFPSLSFPLWSALVRFLDWLPLGPLAGGVALLNAALAAAALGLLYRLLTEGRTERTAATAAVLYLGLSFPFWMVATRSYPQGLGLLLLLGALRELQMFRLTGQRVRFYRFAALYGVGMAEYPSIILLAVPMALYALALLYAKKSLLPRVVVVAAIGCAASGLLLHVAHALYYTSTPAFAWMGFEHTGQVVWEIWRREWLALRYTMGRGGWLLVGLVTLLPWVLTESLTRARQGKRAKWASRAIHLAVLVLLLGVLFNGPMAPWSILGPRPPLLLPVLLASVAFGRAAEYVLTGRWRRSKRAVRPWPVWLQTAALGAVAAFVLVENYPRLETRSARAVGIWVDAVLDGMAGRPWLASDGLLSDSLLLAAHDRGLAIRPLVGSRIDAPGRTASLRAALPTSELKALVPAGLEAVLREWLMTRPDATKEVVLLSSMDPWLAAGLRPLPDRAVYRGLAADENVDLEAHRARQQAFWREWQPAAELWAAAETAEAGFARLLLNQTASVANNLGVFYAYSSNLVFAAEAYEAAMRMDPENICAVLNDAALGGTESTGTVARVKAWVERHPRPVPLSLLARRFGHVREAAALKYLYDGWGIDAAVVDEADQLSLREALAHFYLGEWSEARAQLEPLVGEEHAPATVWALFAAVADAQGDSEAVEKAVHEMESRGERWPAVLFLQGRQAAATGHYHEAALLLREAAARFPADTRTLEALLAVELHLGEGDRPLAVAKALLRLDPGNALANFVIGSDYYTAGEGELARVSLQRSIDRSPTPAALNNLAWLLHEEGQQSDAVVLAEAAVKAAPGNYAFWDTLGMIRLAMGQPEEALDALSRARALVPERPSVAIHLAQCLAALDRTEEVRKALDGVDARLDDLSTGDAEAYRVLATQFGR